MAQQRAVADSESGRQEPRQRAVDRPDEVHAPMDRPEPPACDESGDLRATHPGGDELRRRERAVLTPRQLPEPAINRHAYNKRLVERNKRCTRTRTRRTGNEALAERN